jgi:hypothetical protein
MRLTVEERVLRSTFKLNTLYLRAHCLYFILRQVRLSTEGERRCSLSEPTT